MLYPVGRRATSWRHSERQVARLLHTRFTVDRAEGKFGQAGSRCTDRARENARRPHAAACATEEGHDALESEPPVKRRRPSPSFYMAFTSGSLELVIQRVVEKQNVGGAVAFLTAFQF